MTQEELFESYYVDNYYCNSTNNETGCNVVYDCDPDDCGDETDCYYDD